MPRAGPRHVEGGQLARLLATRTLGGGIQVTRGTSVISVSGIALLQLSKDLFKSQQIETKCNVYNNEECKADWPHLNTRTQ